MARFYFDINEDIETLDPEGSEFPDAEAAIRYAIAAARNLIATSVEKNGSFHLAHRIDVRDENREIIRGVRFGDVVEVFQ